jgi:hypothetical protein
MTLAEATATGLLGPTRPGCELAGPGNIVAALRPPLVGSANFQDGVLETVFLSAGAPIDPGGATTGATWQEMERSLGSEYTVELDKSLEETFGFWFLVVTHRPTQSQPFQGTVDPSTGVVDHLGVPFVPLCE